MPHTKIALVLTVDEIRALREAAADRLILDAFSRHHHVVRHHALIEAKGKLDRALGAPDGDPA